MPQTTPPPDAASATAAPPADAGSFRVRHALLYPRTVALIGASDTPGRLTARPQTFLAKHGFNGTVYPVNPRRETVQGAQAYPTIGDVPEPVDHAYIMLDAEPALTALEACGAAGVPVVTVLADGFAESGGPGIARQERLTAIARAHAITVIGPNSTGVVETSRGFACTSNAAFAADTLPTGHIAVLSQSGSVIGAILSRGAAVGLGFRAFLSVGNEACLGVGEVGAILNDDPDIHGYILFLETMRRPEGFSRFAAAARAAGKPIVAYLVGRSSAGQALATSHTGALAGGARPLQAFLAAEGVHLAETFEGAVELSAALKVRARLAQRPKRATVVTTTGGGGGMVYDLIGLRGVELCAMSEASRAALERQGITIKPGPLVDVTLAGARYELMKALVATLAEDPETGLLVAAIGSSAQFQPELAVRPIVDALRDASPNAAPIVAAPIPHAPESLAHLAAGGVPAFRTPEGCAEAVAALLAPQRAAGQGAPPALPAATTAALNRLAATLSDGRADEVEAADVFATLGIKGPPTVVIGPDEPLPDAMPFGGPYVVKALSRHMAHKSDEGGVALGLRDGAALGEALGTMRERFGDRVDGYLVQPMCSGRGEAIVGLVRDPVVGPIVSVGAGGVLAELYGDVALRPAPVTRRAAEEMLAEVKAFAPLRGYRNLPKGDLGALAEAVAAFSQLATDPRVSEAEINPLLVRGEGDGVVRLDALLVLGAPGA